MTKESHVNKHISKCLRLCLKQGSGFEDKSLVDDVVAQVLRVQFKFVFETVIASWRDRKSHS